MEEKLTKLYNTLMLVETKGENTKLMAQCLNYLQGLVIEARQAASEVQGSTEAGE